MRRMVWLVVAGILALAAGACGADDSDSSARGSAGGDATVGGGDGGDAESAGDEVAAGAADGGGDLGAQAPPAEEAERIIYTADVRVRVDDPSAAAEDAVALVEDAGGSLFTQSEIEGQDQVSVTVRVPVAGFRSALDALAGLGTVLDRSVQAEEVTDQIVDLEGRLENARASADRLRELYATAEGVEQIVSIEQALTTREAEVESLAGQLQQLEDRADRSTITVTFVDEGEPVVDDSDDDASAFVEGLRSGWDVITALGTAVAAVAGFFLPFLPFALVAGLIALVTVRRSRRRSRRTDATAPDGAGPDAAP